MLHFMAYQASVADTSVYADLTALNDQATNQFNSRYVFQEDRRITGAWASGAGLLAGRITTPTLRLISYPEVWPFNASATIPNLPPINEWGENGPLVIKNDEVGFQVSQTSGGASQIYGGIWTEKDPRPAPAGWTTPIRCTGAITGVTSQWVAGPITFSQQLPAGRYAVTGFDVYGTALLFARLIFPNQPTRPGVVCQQAAGEYNWPQWRMGGKGLLGTFYTYAPPQLEIMQTGANTAQSLIMDIVRIGDAG